MLVAMQNFTIDSQEVGQIFYRLFFGLRRMFYMVTPAETTFENLSSARNYLDEAKFWFLAFIVLEHIYDEHMNRGKKLVSLSDSITSANAGLLQGVFKTFTRYIELTIGQWLYENYRLVDLPWDSVWTWVLSLLCVDLSYYWFHRAAHEINILWAFHHMHHSSEYYNFSTALRQGMFQQYGSLWFYLPECLFVPPQVHVAHMSLSLLYQFSMHTRVVDQLGPLEHIFNTPSHHRVHHSSNSYCLGKNYGGFLIIWDKIFGTYQDEKADELLTFGLVGNQLNTHDQLICQQIFQVIKDVQPYQVEVSPFLHAYVLLQYAVSLYIFVEFSALRKVITWYQSVPFVAFLIYSAVSLGQFLDKKSNALKFELVKCFLGVLLVPFFCVSSHIAISILRVLFSVQAFVCFYFLTVLRKKHV